MLSYIFYIYATLLSMGQAEWICWYTDTSDPSCGTYGLSKNKDIAKSAALGLCERHCNHTCTLDYCERM